MTNDPKELLTKSDPILGKIIGELDEPRVVSTKNVFHDLIGCVLEQQIHYRSTKNLFRKMLERAQIDILTLNNFVLFEEKAFQGISLKASKYETVLSIVAYFSNHHLDWELLSDEEVVKHLTSIKGIGKWTIDMILLFTLERPNIFPYHDFHLKQIMVTQYNLNPNYKLKKQMIAVADNWGEHKSLAVKYLLAWKNFSKKPLNH